MTESVSPEHRAIFEAERTYNAWADRPVSDATLRALYDLARFGPTSLNSNPGRFLFLKSAEAKGRLGPCLSNANRDKTLAAPVCVIVAHDMRFHDRLSALYPLIPGAEKWFAGNDTLIERTAFLNGSLQGAYLIVAARMLGLGCGPMSGFDNDGVDREFFPDGRFKSNFLCNLGYGDPAGIRGARGPRLDFDEACKIL